MQFQAGYILGGIKTLLEEHSENTQSRHLLDGLLASLSTFEVSTSLNLEKGDKTPSILAVAHNLITRGLPTLASVDLEIKFSESLGLTDLVEETGQITFPASEKLDAEGILKYLHPIDPRFSIRKEFLNLSNLDSRFEQDFLLNIIPENKAYLTQILDRQRPRNSFTRDNNHGRVDFSLEIPYNFTVGRQNMYNQVVQLKQHKTYVVEVDGARYHEELIDDLKDFEIAQMGANVLHVPEATAYNSAVQLMNTLCDEPYCQAVQENYNDAHLLERKELQLILSPFGIARIQVCLLRYLIFNHELLNSKEVLRIAVIERDLPCARLAIDDLTILLTTLNEVVATQIAIPNFELEVFSTNEFIGAALHKGLHVNNFDDFSQEGFDLILDISLLRRQGVFKDDKKYESAKTIVVRNSHYIHYKTSNPIISAPAVRYRPFVSILENETFEDIEETVALLRKFIRDIFRKSDFRNGQLPILNRALQNDSVIGLLPTGGGKSLTYQLAALLQPGITIVVDPIRSLMLDQYNGLKDLCIHRTEFINSTQKASERQYNQNELLPQGRLQFLFVSPERFVIDEFRMALDNTSKNGFFFGYGVIDEVHCVSEWGHDFRTPYLNLGENIQKYCNNSGDKKVPLLGLTATASFDVLADIERELQIAHNDGNAIVRFENSIRNEINYKIEAVDVDFENLEQLNVGNVRQLIGQKKQERILALIQSKEQIVSEFNKKELLNVLLADSFNNYLSVPARKKEIEKYGTDEAALKRYQEFHTKKVLLGDQAFATTRYSNNQNRYNYGVVCFMPHRAGWLGITNSFNAHGLYDRARSAQGEESYGCFMGGGNDDMSNINDSISFQNLSDFKENKSSVMVATKAFGMGIDKPNVRMTIHINIPQSIESFVQEAGRAGRDGKLATSVVLYNPSKLNLNQNPGYHLDKDVLLYFHKNSFKGQIKERVTIHELRTRVTFPNTTNLEVLVEQLNNQFETEALSFVISPGGNNHPNRLFINTTDRVSVGYLFLDSRRTGIYHYLHNDQLCNQLVEWLAEKIPFNAHEGVAELKNWLERVVVNTRHETGIENLLNGMETDEERSLPVPFNNAFYSKRPKSRQDFHLNPSHYARLKATEAFQQLVQKGCSETALENFLTNAIWDALDYPEFIEGLPLSDETFRTKLLSHTDEVALKFQRAYFLPRTQEDTAKAIYRLISVGIIDSYTIDYQNKLYTLTFKKKKEGAYFDGLESLIARYTSSTTAAMKVMELKASSKQEIKEGKATEMSKCLEYLTNFIYDKIKAKRLQAINDMISLCEKAIEEKDPLKHNQYIKDEIYYYFNAKYTRIGFKEKWVEVNHEGELIEESASASMVDLKDFLGIKEFVEKFIGLVENDRTGEFIGNVKHLRGSAMRMLRSDTEAPQFRILKAFSLFILGDIINSLIKEASEELIAGMIQWKSQEPSTDVLEFFKWFEERVKAHVSNKQIERAFSDIEEHFYISYYTKWLKGFNERLLSQ